MSGFDEAIGVRPAGTGVFEATIDEAWWVVRAPHGGYLASVMLRALTAALDDPARAVRSFTTHYVAPAIRGPMSIRTTIERSGRLMTQVSARAEQDGRAVAISLGAFSAPWPPGVEFEDAPMPDVPKPEEGFEIPSSGEGIPAFLGNVDVRAVLGARPFSGADSSVVGAWMRLREGRTADATVVATLMDTAAPAVWPRASSPVVTPTIDLTIHFREALPLPGAEPEDYYFGRFRSSVAREGFFEEDGELWSADGRLVAQSRQLALVLPMNP